MVPPGFFVSALFGQWWGCFATRGSAASAASAEGSREEVAGLTVKMYNRYIYIYVYIQYKLIIDIYTYIYTHTYIHTYIHIYIYIHMGQLPWWKLQHTMDCKIQLPNISELHHTQQNVSFFHLFSLVVFWQTTTRQVAMSAVLDKCPLTPQMDRSWTGHGQVMDRSWTGHPRTRYYGDSVKAISTAVNFSDFCWKCLVDVSMT